MTEVERIKLANDARLRIAQQILRDVTAGKEYGVDKDQLLAAMLHVRALAERLENELGILT